FKQDAIEKLKQFVPNLEDKEREVYENIIKKMNGTDNSEEKINEIVQVAIAEELLVQNKKSTSQVVIGRNRKNAQTSLDFVKGTSKDGQNYPEYKQELLKEKQRVQDLLDDKISSTPSTEENTDDSSENMDKETKEKIYINKLEEAVKKAEESGEKAKKAEEIAKKAQENGSFSATDQGLVIEANKEVEHNKGVAQNILDNPKTEDGRELDLSEELEQRKNNLQERLNKISEVDVPNISKETLEEFKQDAIEKLKQFVPNLEDKEREVYENIIKKMNG
ncbi:hypothetical protein B8A40_08340, partial [Dolosigranulum pigrum]|uniref:hypothetical protein n=1 Tax=Dolosigranulum pigrum TaxID=29394 RepID=UPI000DC3E723